MTQSQPPETITAGYMALCPLCYDDHHHESYTCTVVSGYFVCSESRARERYEAPLHVTRAQYQVWKNSVETRAARLLAARHGNGKLPLDVARLQLLREGFHLSDQVNFRLL